MKYKKIMRKGKLHRHAHMQRMYPSEIRYSWLVCDSDVAVLIKGVDPCASSLGKKSVAVEERMVHTLMTIN
jgi:hypothetical protein